MKNPQKTSKVKLNEPSAVAIAAVMEPPEAPVRLPAFHALALLSEVGGQGKSTSAEAAVLASMANGHNVRIIAADVQQRLAKKFGEAVTMIDLPPQDILDNDSLALLRAFSPLFEAIRTSANDRADLVIDTAATWAEDFLLMAGEARLDDRVISAGGVLSIGIVATAQPDSMKQLVLTSEVATQHLPSARLIWILNQRLGQIDLRTYNWSRCDLDVARIEAMMRLAEAIAIQRMDDTLWQPMDQAGYSMRAAILANPAEVAPLFRTAAGSIDVMAAEVIQGRLARWVQQTINAFRALLPA